MLKISNSQQFNNEVEKSNGIVIVDFFATWCRPCKMLAPVFEEASNMMRGQAKFVKVDIEEVADIARKYDIKSVPTTMIFKDGKVIDSIVGFIPKNNLLKRLNSHI